MKTVLTIGLTSLGLALAIAQPAEAAFLFICASPFCGSEGLNTIFNVDDFDGGFDVNGSQVQIGLNSPVATSVANKGSFVDGAGLNYFSGSWIDNGKFNTVGDTLFFTFSENTFPGQVNVVLNFNYSQEGNVVTIDGFLVAGTLSTADLAAVGIVSSAPTTIAAGSLFGFSESPSMEAAIQTYNAVPEASTWAMMAIGFAAFAFAGYPNRRSATATG